GPELVELLETKNEWHRRTALRLIGDRKDKSLIPLLEKNIAKEKGQLALESLWALNLCEGLTDKVAAEALHNANPMVRDWTERLRGDRNEVSSQITLELAVMARNERDPQVRSQLASTAKRLPPFPAMSLIVWFLNSPQNQDANDIHIPMLIWWAIESKAESTEGRKCILSQFDEPRFWHLPLVENVIAERIVQRYAMAGDDENLESCARLLRATPDRASLNLVLKGLEKAFAGRAASSFPTQLRTSVAQA